MHCNRLDGLFKYYKRLMFQIIIIVALALSSQSLRLRGGWHTAQSSSQLREILQGTVSKLNNINQSIDQTLSSLNPYSQIDRISALENTITAARNQLLDVYGSCVLPLANSQYYCQSIPSNLANDLKTSLGNIKTNAQQLNQLSQFTTSNNSLNGIPASMTSAAQAISDDVAITGTVVSSPPNQTNLNNFLGSKWVLGNSSISDISKQNLPKLGENGKTCPTEAPYIDKNGSCISCSHYYNAQTMSCIECVQFDQSKHLCNDAPNANQSNISNGNSNSVTNLRVSNSNNLTGLMLPEGTTLQDYKQSLLLNPQNQNILPCPSETPFFDGTSCIHCPLGQYFSVTAKVCQTCPSQQTYNPSTFHCEFIAFYSNPNAKYWTSISTPPADILKQMATSSLQPNAKPCPEQTPYFDGKNCVGCSEPTPIYSYDGLKCTTCIAPTMFDPNIYSCASKQRMQTSPSNTPNLILEGRSLNQWKTNYYNTQTADPQVSDCPTSKPFFDGITCINCPADNPYFNMQYKICQVCPKQTEYDTKVRQCLSTSGNIVTQSPNVLKMAAGIFA